MATSIRYQIIQRVKTVLETITVANGYLTNVASVSDGLTLKAPEELDDDQFPACFILDEDETKQAFSIFSDTVEDMQSILSISVTSIVFSRAGSTMLARTNLMQDVEKAIVGDATLEALLLEKPSPIGVETDQGYFGNYSVFKQTFDVQYIYNHTTGGA